MNRFSCAGLGGEPRCHCFDRYAVCLPVHRRGVGAHSAPLSTRTLIPEESQRAARFFWVESWRCVQRTRRCWFGLGRPQRSPFRPRNGCSVWGSGMSPFCIRTGVGKADAIRVDSWRCTSISVLERPIPEMNRAVETAGRHVRRSGAKARSAHAVVRQPLRAELESNQVPESYAAAQISGNQNATVGADR